MEQIEWDRNSVGGFQLSLLDFGNNTHIFSMSATLVEGEEGESGLYERGLLDNSGQRSSGCALLFLDEGGEVVLVSEPVQIR